MENEDPVDLQFNQSGYLFLANENVAHIMEENYRTQRFALFYELQETRKGSAPPFEKYLKNPALTVLQELWSQGFASVPSPAEGEVSLGEYRRRSAGFIR